MMDSLRLSAGYSSVYPHPTTDTQGPCVSCSSSSWSRASCGSTCASWTRRRRTLWRLGSACRPTCSAKHPPGCNACRRFFPRCGRIAHITAAGGLKGSNPKPGKWSVSDSISDNRSGSVSTTFEGLEGRVCRWSECIRLDIARRPLRFGPGSLPGVADFFLRRRRCCDAVCEVTGSAKVRTPPHDRLLLPASGRRRTLTGR